MAKKGHSEEEIPRVLREAESGETVVEVCRKHGISQQSFYLWKKKYSGLGLSELRELRQLREENNKLKRLVAELSLDGWNRETLKLIESFGKGLDKAQDLCPVKQSDLGSAHHRMKSCEFLFTDCSGRH